MSSHEIFSEDSIDEQPAADRLKPKVVNLPKNHVQVQNFEYQDELEFHGESPVKVKFFERKDEDDFDDVVTKSKKSAF
jgi:hypothetical protein